MSVAFGHAKIEKIKDFMLKNEKPDYRFGLKMSR